MNETWHGTSGGYTNHKCRCDECRAAWAAAFKRWRHSRQGRCPDTAHGTDNGYLNYGCRCDECKAAYRITSLDRYRRLRSAEARGSLRGKVCIREHALEGNNLYVRKDGKKACRECCRIRGQQFRQKRADQK